MKGRKGEVKHEEHLFMFHLFHGRHHLRGVVVNSICSKQFPFDSFRRQFIYFSCRLVRPPDVATTARDVHPLQIKREALKRNCSHYCLSGCCILSLRRRGILFHQTSRGHTFTVPNLLSVSLTLGCGRREHLGPIVSALCRRTASPLDCLFTLHGEVHHFGCSFAICFTILLTNHRLLRKAISTPIIRALELSRLLLIATHSHSLCTGARCTTFY